MLGLIFIFYFLYSLVCLFKPKLFFQKNKNRFLILICNLSILIIIAIWGTFFDGLNSNKENTITILPAVLFTIFFLLPLLLFNKSKTNNNENQNNKEIINTKNTEITFCENFKNEYKKNKNTQDIFWKNFESKFNRIFDIFKSWFNKNWNKFLKELKENYKKNKEKQKEIEEQKSKVEIAQKIWSNLLNKIREEKMGKIVYPVGKNMISIGQLTRINMFQVKIDYEDSYGDETTRDVDIMIITKNEGGYIYLHCYDYKSCEERTFRAERIKCMYDRKDGEVYEIISFLENQVKIKLNDRNLYVLKNK